jgi:hypothetical protein
MFGSFFVDIFKELREIQYTKQTINVIPENPNKFNFKCLLFQKNVYSKLGQVKLIKFEKKIKYSLHNAYSIYFQKR